MSLLITPRTRLGEILAAYPELEEVLLAYSPHFAKLRNPILRRTVAKVATLQAAAATAGVDVADLVSTLRARVGQQVVAEAKPADVPGLPGGAKPITPDTPTPAWIAAGKISLTIDVDEMLNREAHPLGVVQQFLADTSGDQIIQLISSFRPEPLIESLTSSGHRVHASRRPDQRWVTLVAKGNS